MDKLLRLENITYNYHTDNTQTTALQNVNFTVDEGEFIAIIGPSGCGKTTILSIIAGLIKPSVGKIFLNDKQIEKADNSLGYMLQRDELFPWRTIEKNVLLPLEIKKIKTKENVEYANSLLDKYGLKNFKKAYPNMLSGGMKQRTALIRTLASSPLLLLLDEPFSALDYQTRLEVCNDVYSIIKSEKKTAILVTHDISEAISMADRILVLSKRPACVKKVYNIEIDKSVEPLKRREDKMFLEYFELLYKELQDEKITKE